MKDLRFHLLFLIMCAAGFVVLFSFLQQEHLRNLARIRNFDRPIDQAAQPPTAINFETQLMSLKKQFCESIDSGLWNKEKSVCAVEGLKTSAAIFPADGPSSTLPKFEIGRGYESQSGQISTCFSASGAAFCEKQANGQNTLKCRRGSRSFLYQGMDSIGAKRIQKYICQGSSI